MVRINNIKVYDLNECIIASGYPMQIGSGSRDIGSTNIDRAIRLAKLSGGHDNFLKGIRVSFDVRYPQYFSQQLQRYLFNDIVSSQSKMHRLKAMPLKDCVNKYVQPDIIKACNYLQNKYNTYPTYENYIILLSNIPLGLELSMRCSTNYMCLKNIYKQRKNHKLKEDWGAFCEFIENLPYAKEFLNTKKD